MTSGAGICFLLIAKKVVTIHGLGEGESGEQLHWRHRYAAQMTVAALISVSVRLSHLGQCKADNELLTFERSHFEETVLVIKSVMRKR